MNSPKMNFRGLLYPGILIITVFCIAASATLAVRFLTFNINAAFDVNKSALEASAVKVNIEDYRLAAKKLGIPYPAELSPLIPLPVLEEQQ